MSGLSLSTFKRFRDLLATRFGIEYNNSHLEQMENRLRSEVEKLSPGNFDEYFLKVQNNEEICKKFLSLLSTNKTNFFRHPEQFKVFSDNLLKEIKNYLRPGEPYRILSAGCSRGAELYTLLMILDFHGLSKLNPIEAFGLDVDSEELAIARKGLFSEENMLDIPKSYLSQYFKKVGSDYQINHKFIDQGHFQFFNLMNPLTFGVFDLIFCRNCLIYFKETNKNRITEELFRSLKLGGFLFLSPNEFIRDNYNGSLKEVDYLGQRVYKKINPVSEYVEFHFKSNLDLMKIQKELDKQGVSHKLVKYPQSSNQGPSRYIQTTKESAKSVESLLQSLGIPFTRKTP